MRMLALAVFAGLLLPVAGDALAHGGGLNAEGCHNNRKTGDYHCHRAPSVERRAPERPSIPAPNQAGEQRRSLQSGSSSSDGPTCYTGPRGGTYTITPSGRKNYSGC